MEAEFSVFGTDCNKTDIHKDVRFLLFNPIYCYVRIAAVGFCPPGPGVGFAVFEIFPQLCVYFAAAVAEHHIKIRLTVFVELTLTAFDKTVACMRA